MRVFICLGIGLNMLFPDFMEVVDSPPTVKEVFKKSGFGSIKIQTRKGNVRTHLTRTQNK